MHFGFELKREANMHPFASPWPTHDGGWPEPSSPRRRTKTKGPRRGCRSVSPRLTLANGARGRRSAGLAGQQSCAAELARGPHSFSRAVVLPWRAELLHGAQRRFCGTRRRSCGGPSSPPCSAPSPARAPSAARSTPATEPDNWRRRFAGREVVGGRRGKEPTGGRQGLLFCLCCWKSIFLGWRPIYCAGTKSLQWVALLGSVVGDSLPQWSFSFAVGN
jgi:hypothetical protein